MTKEEYIQYFRTLHGRNPEPKEFMEAIQSGEITTSVQETVDTIKPQVDSGINMQQQAFTTSNTSNQQFSNTNSNYEANDVSKLGLNYSNIDGQNLTFQSDFAINKKNLPKEISLMNRLGYVIKCRTGFSFKDLIICNLFTYRYDALRWQLLWLVLRIWNLFVIVNLFLNPPSGSLLLIGTFVSNVLAVIGYNIYSIKKLLQEGCVPLTIMDKKAVDIILKK